MSSLSQADAVCSVPSLIDGDMVRESISSMKNGKALVPSGVASEMIKKSRTKNCLDR